MTREQVAILRELFAEPQEVWASVESELNGAKSDPKQAQAVHEFISSTLTHDESLLVYAIRRGDVQKQLCNPSSDTVRT